MRALMRRQRQAGGVGEPQDPDLGTFIPPDELPRRGALDAVNDTRTALDDSSHSRTVEEISHS